MGRRIKLVELNPQATQVVGDLSGPELEALCDHFSYIDPSSHRPGSRWSGIVSLVSITQKGVLIPTGLLVPVSMWMQKTLGRVPQIVLARPSLDEGFSRVSGSFGYQTRCVESWTKARGRGGINIPMGGGKTSYIAPGCISVAFTSRAATKAIFLCERLDVLMQAQVALAKALPAYKVGIIGGGQCNLGDITVATVQSLNAAWGDCDGRGYKDEDYYDKAKRPHVVRFVQEAEMWVFDEYHHLQAMQYRILMKRAPKSWFRLGMSGTPISTEGKDIVIDALTGPIVEDVTYKELIEHDPPVLAKPTFVVYWMPPQRLPVAQHTNHPSSKYAAYYEAYITKNDLRNGIIAKFAKEAEGRGETTAILVTRKEHGFRLAEAIPGSLFVHGDQSKWPMQKRSEIWKALHRKEIKVVISTLIKEALDIPSLDNMVYACAGDSEVTFPQSWRCMRSDGGKKATCRILTFRDYNATFSKHSEAQLDMMNHPGFKIVHINRPERAKKKVRSKARRRAKLKHFWG